jgi:hypothetical protein
LGAREKPCSLEKDELKNEEMDKNSFLIIGTVILVVGTANNK